LSVCLQLADVDMLQHEADNTQHLELLTEHISTLELDNSRLKGRVEVMLARIITVRFFQNEYSINIELLSVIQ